MCAFFDRMDAGDLTFYRKGRYIWQSDPFTNVTFADITVNGAVQYLGDTGPVAENLNMVKRQFPGRGGGHLTRIVTGVCELEMEKPTHPYRFFLKLDPYLQIFLTNIFANFLRIFTLIGQLLGAATKNRDF